MYMVEICELLLDWLMDRSAGLTINAGLSSNFDVETGQSLGLRISVRSSLAKEMYVHEVIDYNQVWSRRRVIRRCCGSYINGRHTPHDEQ
jgi:hypothetical protein